MMNKHKISYSVSICIALAGFASACSDDSKNVENTLTCGDGLTICGHACCADTCCDGVCVNTKNDKNNCGTCGNACLDDKVCMNNTCVASEEACLDGQEWCNGECVNVQSDAKHCGDCSTRCKDGESCQSGKCAAGCAQNYTLVGDGKCVDTQRDSENCGGEGNVCGDNAYCADGSCSCRNGYFDCDSDMANGCESQVACDFPCEPTQQLCADSGTCCNAGAECCGASCCEAGSACCGGDTCLDLKSDPHHCGKCDKECNANQICESGECKDAEIPCDDVEGMIACWGECVQSYTDKDNCGECGHACDEGLVCAQGECTIACADDETVCKLEDKQYCAKLAEDPQNCGTCGHVCETSQVCVAGDEGVAECKEFSEVQPDFTCSPILDPSGEERAPTLCWGNCVDVQTDARHCGVCGNACGEGYECTTGVCTKVCDPSLNACGDTCHDFLNDVHACGNCDTQCLTTQTCVEGVCTDSDLNCNEGADPEDPSYVEKTLCWGTCADLMTDTAHCGACDVACGENQTCTDGKCADIPVEPDPGTCNAPMGMCYGVCKDLQNDDANCGKCLNACGTGEKCIEGKCELQCGSLTVCDKACIDTTSSDKNCGACGAECKDGQTCVGSACQCAEGRKDCDNDPSNGCEAPADIECCVPGETRACWRGLPENRGKGICKDGTQTCDASGQFWGPCTGGVYPSAITCDEAGLPYPDDRNCNGIADANDDCVTKCDLSLSDSSYIGCEYWAAYTQNYDSRGNFAVVISNMGNEDATVYAYYGGKKVDTRTVMKGSVETIILSRSNDNNAMLSGTTIQANGFRIVSTKPVTAYQFNPLREGAIWNDALLLLPKNVYGKKYYNIIGGSADTYIAIQATSPGKTKITVKPNMQTIAGTNRVTNTAIASLAANSSNEFVLNQYEVFQLSAADSMTGTEVTGDRPFVAIGGCASCYNARKMSGDVYDHYSEQLFPYQSWGSEYAFAGFEKERSERDQWRVLAAEDAELTITPAISNLNGTSGSNYSTIGGASKVSIKAGVPYDIVTQDNFHMKSNKPVLVAGFLGDEGASKDSSYSLVVPVQQYRSDYSFMIPQSYNYNHITIIAPKDISFVKIYRTAGGTDTPVAEFNNSQFTPISGTNYVYRRHSMGTTHAAYKLVADKPVGVQCYGYYNQTSYAYPLGLNLIKLNNTN